jgi:hypothetical protein
MTSICTGNVKYSIIFSLKKKKIKKRFVILYHSASKTSSRNINIILTFILCMQRRRKCMHVTFIILLIFMKINVKKNVESDC